MRDCKNNESMLIVFFGCIISRKTITFLWNKKKKMKENGRTASSQEKCSLNLKHVASKNKLKVLQ